MQQPNDMSPLWILPQAASVSSRFSNPKSNPTAPLASSPAGRISEKQVITQFLSLMFAGLGTAWALDNWAGHDQPTLLYLAIFGSFISYIYSAPPLKLKQNGWTGNYALGASYIALPWWAGQVRGSVALASIGEAKSEFNQHPLEK